MIVALTVPFLYDRMLLFFDRARCKCPFFQAVSVVGRGSSPKPAVDVLSLFSHFLFWIRWNGRELHILPSCFPTAPLMSVSFALLFVLDIMWCCVLFADVCVLQKGGVLSRAGHSFFSVSAILFFLSFCMKIFYICISLFLLFISSFFSFRCFSCLLVLSICLDGSSLSFRFFSCLLYSIFIYPFSFFNSISLYKH